MKTDLIGLVICNGIDRSMEIYLLLLTVENYQLLTEGYGIL